MPAGAPSLQELLRSGRRCCSGEVEVVEGRMQVTDTMLAALWGDKPLGQQISSKTKCVLTVRIEPPQLP